MIDIFAGSLMSAPVETVSAEMSLQHAAQTMLDHGVGSVVVVDGAGHLEGILTTTDFVQLAADDRSAAETDVGTAMSTDVVTANATDSIEDVAASMIDHDFHHVPVVDQGAVVGIVTTADLVAYLSDLEAGIR